MGQATHEITFSKANNLLTYYLMYTSLKNV